jgi:hypothetical protein
LNSACSENYVEFTPSTKNGDETKSGGSLLVKIDIEGAEYAILKELEATWLICDYVQMGNNATLVVEYHEHLIRDAEEKRQAAEGLKKVSGRTKKLRGAVQTASALLDEIKYSNTGE